MGVAKVIQFDRAAVVFQALRLRAHVDKVPTERLHQACQTALRLLDQGRSTGLAISEGVKAMRPLRTVRAPGGVA